MRDLKNMYEDKIHKLEKELKDLLLEKEPHTSSSNSPRLPDYVLKQSTVKREIFARSSPGDFRSSREAPT